jgi:hypothetical protein
MTPRKDPRQAMLDRLRAKGLGLAPHMVDGRIVSAAKTAAVLPSPGAPVADWALERTPLPERGSRPADRLTAPGTVFEFKIFAPCTFLNANRDKGHWSGPAPKVRAWRRAGRLAAADADLPTGVPRLQVDCFVIKPIQNDYDPANWAPTAKAVLDGLIDYGLAEDDNRRFVTGPFMHEGGKGEDALLVRVTVLDMS